MPIANKRFEVFLGSWSCWPDIPPAEAKRVRPLVEQFTELVKPVVLHHFIPNWRVVLLLSTLIGMPFRMDHALYASTVKQVIMGLVGLLV